MEQSKKYNFDFESGRPLKVEGGRWEGEVRAKLMPRGTTIPIIKEPLLGLIAVDNAIQRYSSSHSQGFRGVVFGYSPRLVGRYCSYLLPMQALESQLLANSRIKT